MSQISTELVLPILPISEIEAPAVESAKDTKDTKDLKDKKEAIESRTRALFDAIHTHRARDVAIVKDLVAEGVELETELNAQESTHNFWGTPLMAACLKAVQYKTYVNDRTVLIDIIKILLKAGANIEYQSPGDTFCSTPLTYVTHRGDTKLTELLIAHGANVNNGLPLMDAIYQLQTLGISIPLQLIEKGADVNFIFSPSRRNALSIMMDNYASCEYLEVMEDVRTPLALLDAMFKAGLNPNLTSYEDNNALHYVLGFYTPKALGKKLIDARNAFKEILSAYFIKRNTNFYQRNKKGDTPIACIKYHATDFTEKTICHLMKIVDSDPSLQLNEFNDNAFDLVSRYGCIHGLDILLRRGINEEQIRQNFLRIGTLYSAPAPEVEVKMDHDVPSFIDSDPDKWVYGDSNSNVCLYNVRRRPGSDEDIIRSKHAILNTLKWFLKHVDSETILKKLKTPPCLNFILILMGDKDLRQGRLERRQREFGKALTLLQQEITSLVLSEWMLRCKIEFLNKRTEEDLFLKWKDKNMDVEELREYLSKAMGGIVDRPSIPPSCFPIGRLVPINQQLYPYWILTQHKDQDRYNVYWDPKQNKDMPFIFYHLPDELKIRILHFLEEMPIKESLYVEGTKITPDISDDKLVLFSARFNFVETLALKQDQEAVGAEAGERVKGKMPESTPREYSDKGDKKSNTQS